MIPKISGITSTHDETFIKSITKNETDKYDTEKSESDYEENKGDTAKDEDDDEVVAFNPQLIRLGINNTSKTGTYTKSLKSVTSTSLGPGFNFNNNANTNTVKTAFDGASFHYTQRTQSKNNTYLLTISKGYNLIETMTQNSLDYSKLDDEQAQEKLIRIFEEMTVED